MRSTTSGRAGASSALSRCYIGLGSNLGDREANLEAAVGALSSEAGVRVLRQSGVYETEPVGVVDQGWFFNAVVEIESALGPPELLAALKRIEARLGRRPGRRWGERLIDLDLLLYDDLVVGEPDLTIPHPELWRRLFVLLPLAEVARDLRAPDGRTVQEAIAGLEGSQGIRRLAAGRG